MTSVHSLVDIESKLYSIVCGLNEVVPISLALSKLLFQQISYLAAMYIPLFL